MHKHPLAIITYCAFGLWIFLILISLRSVSFDDTQRVLVRRGDGLWGVAQTLKEEGVIRSRSAFIIYATLVGRAHRLQAGEYTFSEPISTPAVIKKLTSGPAGAVITLIHEGFDLAQVDARLAERGVLETGQLLSFDWTPLREEYFFLEKAMSLEGFLFPDTYQFSAYSRPIDVVRTMLDTFKDKALPLFPASLDDDANFIYKTIITASLIEREVPDYNDRRTVSGIIQNRINIGMPLQIDAAPSTYDHKGLPPTPIANPSASAIQAALAPKSTSYLYYLSDPDTKRTIFSVTFEEHVENKFRYLR